MRLSTFSALSSLFTASLAHSQLWGVWLNGQGMGDGRNSYIRSPPNNSPVMNVTSPDMYCNVNCNTQNHRHHSPRSCSCVHGSSRWKSMDEDLRGQLDGKQWATDYLRAARGQHTIIVPDVPAGDYTLRAEIITLHLAETVNSENAARGAEFYPGCVQIKVTSDGNHKLPGKATFPGAYTGSDEGLHFDLRNAGLAGLLAYEAPGPAVWSEAAGGSIGRVGKLPTGEKMKPTATTPSGHGLVGVWGQCGGVNYHGPKTCVPGSACVFSNSLFHQCRPGGAAGAKAARARAPLWGQCGGKNYSGPTFCTRGECHFVSEWFFQCIL